MGFNEELRGFNYVFGLVLRRLIDSLLFRCYFWAVEFNFLDGK